MFKPTPSLQKMLRRLPLSPKQAGKEYYKGNRVGSMGTIDRFGNFKPDWDKVRTYVYPEHGTRTALTPFVGANIEKTHQPDGLEFKNHEKTFTGKDYLRAWKESNGYETVATEGADAVQTRHMPVPFEERPAAKS